MYHAESQEIKWEKEKKKENYVRVISNISFGIQT